MATSRAKVRDHRRGLQVTDEAAGAVADAVLPSSGAKAKAKAKGRGKGLSAPDGQ